MFITKDILYAGVNDHQVDLFEGQYTVPNGMAYNSYVILDDKIAVMDTVDRHFQHEWLDNLALILGGRKPDYLVVQHMEPDHSANIASFLSAYPEAAVVANAKTFAMIDQFFGPGLCENKVVVKDGESLSLGKHTLTFVFAPMVHWPEVMVTYDSTDKVLFSADGFGKFGALDVSENWADEARRYYIGIVGKYGGPVQKALQKVRTLPVGTICSTHGPVWQRQIAKVLDIYDRLSRYEGEPGAVVAYGSMYGNTEQMAETVARGLAAAGVRPIVVYNLSTADVSQVLRDIFRYDTLVVGSPTYNGQLYPPVDALLRKIAERCIPHRRFACFGSFTWAGAAVRRMTEFAEGMKWPVVGAPVELKQGYSTAVEPACRTLVDALVEDMKR